MMERNEAWKGIFIIPMMIVIGCAYIAFEIVLALLILGPTLIPAGIALFPCMLMEGHGEPWKAKTKWIRYMALPYLKSHAFFCKIQGLKQRA